MKPATLPRTTFARKIVTMQGYGREQAITEIASVDAIAREEAARRYDAALAQHIRRSVGQSMRHYDARARRTIEAEVAARRNAECRALVLRIAQRSGMFACPEHLRDVSAHAGWGRDVGADSTGRAYVDFVLPLVREGLLSEHRDDDDRLRGYVIAQG